MTTPEEEPETISLHPSARARTVSRGASGELVITTRQPGDVGPLMPLAMGPIAPTGIYSSAPMTWCTTLPVTLPPTDRTWSVRVTGDTVAVTNAHDIAAARAKAAEAQLASQLAALRYAAHAYLCRTDEGHGVFCDRLARLQVALRDTAQAGESYRRCTRAEALEEAADALRGHGEDSAAALWLRARAKNERER